MKEMRAEDIRNGRTGNMVRPRFLVWENVVGAFSSNKGKDFAAVLEEIIKIVEPEAPGIEVPEKGWPNWGGYHDEVGGRWSVVWRTHDAQYWGKTIRDSRTGDVLQMGTPQCRRRISVVADFGGDAAGEILFECESLPGYPAESGEAGEGLAEAVEIGVNPAVARSITARNDGSPCADRGPNIVCSPHQGGCDGGGKGALVQTEKSGTLGTGNDQTIFCLATQQGGAELRTDDGAPTLTAAAGMSGNNQPVICIKGNAIDRNTAQNGAWCREDKSYTLDSTDRHGVMCAGFKAGQGAQAGGIGYSEEVSPTLASTPSGTNQTPAVMAFDTTQITSKENGSKPEFGKPCHSLNANAHVPCVALDMPQACDVIRECGEQVPALQARMGTGGNQVPLTYQMQGFGDYREGTTASSCKQRDYKDGTDLICSSVDCRNFTEGGELNGTLQAKESGGTSLNLNNTVRQNMVVRRLTPLECTRLQGYPDGWVDIGDWVDEQGKKHKEADSPKYKALGNSIALPFWQWMIDRMAKYLPENATLGSLFDGIGGFPLCWSRTHSPACCRWASEIEPFPIAVTKMRFGEE